MIIEGKKNTAFDLMEAAMTLSDIYHKNNSNKSVTFYICGIAETFDIAFLERNAKGKIVGRKSFCIYLNENAFADTFEQAFEEIEKELAQYE